MYFLKILLNYRYDIGNTTGACDLSAEDAYSLMALDPTCTSNKVHVCSSPVFLIFTFGLWIKLCSISPHVKNNIIKKYLRSPFLIFAHKNCFHFVKSHACFYNITILNILWVIEQFVMSKRHITLYNYRSFKHVYWLILT